MKKCSKCNIEKELSEFYKDKRTKSGCTSRCKDCLKIDTKEYNENNKEKRLEYKREYRKSEKHKQYQENYQREYYLNNKEDIEAKRKEYIENNKEEYIARIKAWVKNTTDKQSKYKERRRNSSYEYYLNNKEKVNAKSREYYENNKHEILINKNEYKMKRYNEDIIFRCSVNIRSSIRQCFKKNTLIYNHYVAMLIDILKKTILMNKSEIIETLGKFDNDTNFRFDALQHKYTYNNEHFISVTQFISKFHTKFDSEKWSKIKAAERGITKAEILAEWKEKNDRANIIGTSLHNYVEGYFKEEYQKIPIDKDVINRINKFNIIYSEHLHKLEPIKFEQRIFSKKYKIAGMIDSLFMYQDKIICVDWKTNKDFTDDNHPKGKYENLLYPFDFLYKNHQNEYSIQISMYMLILKEYGIDVRQGYLLHIGPETDAKIYKCLNLTELLEEYLNKE